MSSLSLKHIYKVYDGNVKAVNDFCMDIEDKEFIVFVGPSGCGKSTTLRMIAGLEEISAGELLIDGKVMNDYEPKDRNIAMVFQNYALYPHMSVFNNMAFSLKIAHLPKEEIKKKVQEAAEILGITEYLDRKPKALSGGQRQRVALGRAIVRNPKVFLLDEPLSNLDAKLRANMRAEITRLHNRLQTTFIYVTHDQVEAMTMGSRIVVMKAGYVQQIDTPKNLYNYPCNMFVAGFIGTPQMNFYDATISKDGNNVSFNLANGTTIGVDYALVNKILKKYMDGNHQVVVGIRPDDIRICNQPLDENKWHIAKVVVDVKESLGAETLLHCNFNLQNSEDEDGAVVVKVGPDCALDSGDVIDIAINKEALHVFDKESEQSLKPRIPAINETDAKVVGVTLTFAGQTMILPDAFKGKTTDGDSVLTIPSDAIRIGDGTCIASIVGKEIIAQKALYQLNVGGEVLFALSDDTSKELGATVFDVDMTKISMSGDCTVDALDTQNHLDCTFAKVREEGQDGKKINAYYLQIGEQNIVCPDEIVKRLLDVKGRKIYKTPLALTVDAKDISISNEGCAICGTVVEILDYGNAKFARVNVGASDVIVVVEEEINLQDSVRLTIDMNKISLNDTAHDIILW